MENRPRLYDDLVFDFKAFWSLSRSRSVGFAEWYIPMSEIYAYMQIHRIDDLESRRIFVDRIAIMDDEFMSFQDKKSQKANKKPTKE